MKPLDFSPGERYNEERKNLMPVNKDGFLWPEEEKLVHYLIKVDDKPFLGQKMKRGNFPRTILSLWLFLQWNSHSSENL